MWVSTLLCWERAGNLIAEYARHGLKKCMCLIVRGYKHQEQFVSFLKPLSSSSAENLGSTWCGWACDSSRIWEQACPDQSDVCSSAAQFVLTTECVSWGACHPRGWTRVCSAESCLWQRAGWYIVGKSVLTQIRGRYKKQENWTTWNNSRALPLNV